MSDVSCFINSRLTGAAGILPCCPPRHSGVLCASSRHSVRSNSSRGDLGTSTAAAWEKRLLTRCYSDRPFLKAVLRLPIYTVSPNPLCRWVRHRRQPSLKGDELNTGQSPRKMARTRAQNSRMSWQTARRKKGSARRFVSAAIRIAIASTASARKYPVRIEFAFIVALLFGDRGFRLTRLQPTVKARDEVA